MIDTKTLKDYLARGKRALERSEQRANEARAKLRHCDAERQEKLKRELENCICAQLFHEGYIQAIEDLIARSE